MTTINRLVLNFPGFESTTSTHQIERLTAGGHKTGKLWGFELQTTPIETREDAHLTETSFTTNGDNWNAQIRYVQFSWSDIIERYENVPYPVNLARHFSRYLAFFTDGTVLKYFKASKRYWGFTLYPFLLLLIFAVIAWFAASGIASLLGVGIWLSLPLAFLIWLGLGKIPGDTFYTNLSINDWAFARDMCLQSNPEIEQRYQSFAEQAMAEIRDTNAEEIIIVGHSFGAVWAVMALSILIERDPGLLEGKRITFLALGSSLLKIALVNKAQYLRDAITRVLDSKRLVWHELQTKTDFVSFYKSDPFTPLGLSSPHAEVIVHRINFKKALSKKRHRKMKKSMYLAHRQYILYCDLLVHHDFQLRVFGPHFADELARDTQLALTSNLLTSGLTNDH